MENQLPPLLKGRKASEVFMEYVEPYLSILLLDRVQKGVYEVPSPESIEKILKLPWYIWNAAVAEKVLDDKTNFLDSMQAFVQGIPECIKELLDFMKKRKRDEFSQYQYYLGEYKIYYNKNNELRIRMESRLPPSFLN